MTGFAGTAPPELDDLAHRVIGAAMEVHTVLGPGLTETVYELALFEELRRRQIAFLRQVAIPIDYKGVRVGLYRLDLVVANQLVLELKAVEKILAVHRAQLLTYLRAADLPLGLVINFNASSLREGITRVVA